MNEKTEKQIANMKNQTIGVEVEMNSITRLDAAKVAAEYFGTHRVEDTAYRNGYSTVSAWDAQGREWKFQKDVSIAGDEAHKCEMVTPILNYSDIESLQELCRRLRKAGAKSDATRGCGVHIHIGAADHTALTALHLTLLSVSSVWNASVTALRTAADRQAAITASGLTAESASALMKLTVPGVHRHGIMTSVPSPSNVPLI